MECHELFLGLLLRGANVEKWGDDQEKKFFIDDTAQALIPFKKRHKSLLKPHVRLGGGRFGVEKKEGNFIEVEKKRMGRLFRIY